VLRSAPLKLFSPNNIPRPGFGFQAVQDGWRADWSGFGTFKQQTFRQSTREMGAGQQFMAVARSRAIPQDLNIVPGSWKLYGPDGIWYEVANVTRTGNLTTLNLQQAVQQSGDNL